MLADQRLAVKRTQAMSNWDLACSLPETRECGPSLPAYTGSACAKPGMAKPFGDCCGDLIATLGGGGPVLGLPTAIP